MKPQPQACDELEQTPPSSVSMGAQLEALDKLMAAYQQKCIQVVRLQREMDEYLEGPGNDAVMLLIDAKEVLEQCQASGTDKWMQKYKSFMTRYGQKEKSQEKIEAAQASG